MIGLIVKDPWTLVSFFGITLMSASQWIAANVNPIIAGLTGFFALVLILLGIVEKYLIIRQKWAERKSKSKR